MKLFDFDPVVHRPLCARSLLVALVLGTGCGMVDTDTGDQDGAAATGGHDAASGGRDAAASGGRGEGTGGASSGSGGESVGVAGAGAGPSDPVCGGSVGSDLQIAKQAFDVHLPWAKVLYTWTVPEQEAILRSERTLLTVGEMPGLGKGLAMDLLTQVAEESPGSIEAQVNAVFAKFRYAWTNPWATLIGPDGEDYGGRLVKMVLRDDAWVGLLDTAGHIFKVIDRDGNDVPEEQLAASPERIAALYFVRLEVNGGPLCSTFSQSPNGGYREFIVGNEAMLEEWSIGTSAIRHRIESDITTLSEYADAVSSCPPASAAWGDGFNASTVCGWGFNEDPYLQSLALPSEAYRPTPEHLSTLIESLDSTLFELDPLVVVIEP